jgi:hypothetical protein
MLYLVKTTLQYCKSQELAWDPKKDLTFLCQNYASEIGKIRQQLNQKEVQEMYLSTSYFAKLSPDDQRKCYHVLLDKDPPPLMSITPPPPQTGHRVPDSAPGKSIKPTLLSQKPLPAISTEARPSSSFLSPPKTGKPKSRPAQPPLSTPGNQTIGTGLHAQLVPIYSTAPDSRSRYRATSAPDSPNAGTNKSFQLAAPASSTRPMSMNPKGPQQQANPAFYSSARTVGVQNGPNFSRPQVVQVQSHAHASQSAQPMGPALQKSMPNLKPPPTAQVPLPTSSHKIIPPGPRNSYIPPQSGSYTIAPTSTAGTRNTQAKSSPHNGLQGAPQGQHINDRAKLPNSSSAFQSKGAPILAERNIPPPGQRLQQQNSKSIPNLALTSHLPSAEVSSAPAVGLRLVGPEGVYTPPTKVNQAKRPSPAGAMNNTHKPHTVPAPVSGPPVSVQASFAFELDAGPAQQPVARSLSPQELPTNPIMSKTVQSNANQAPSAVQIPKAMKNTSNSQSRPVAPPELAHLAHDVVSPLSPPINVLPQPSNSQNELFPTDNIPMSLMAGGAARQRSPSRSPHNSPQRTPQHSPQPSQNMQTNASRYTAYFSPSSSPNNGQTQPYAAPLSAYKAYSGPISPPVSASTTGILQKSQTFGAPQITFPTAHDPTYAANDAQQSQYSFPNSNPQAGNFTPPISPPESRDSHHPPPNQNMYASSKENGDAMGAPAYTAFSYRNSGELHMSAQAQSQSQTPMQPQTQAQAPNQEPVWFAQAPNQAQVNAQPQQHPQLQHQQQQQQHQWSQPQPQTQSTDEQLNAQPQQHPQLQHQLQQQQWSQLQSQTQITNEQSNVPAPLQWTHPSLQKREYNQDPPSQTEPQALYIQTPNIEPLSQSNLAIFDSPTTPQHTRSTSHDSVKLAQEYQSELPVFGERGYGSGKIEQNEFVQMEVVQRSDSGRPQDAWRQSVTKKEEMKKRASEQYEFIDFT